MKKFKEVIIMLGLKQSIELEKVFIIADLHLFKKNKPNPEEEFEYWIEKINKTVRDTE
jgi:hypothetical protein